MFPLQADVLFNKGLDELPAHVDNVLENAHRYFNNTAEEVRHWSTVNFDELDVSFDTAWVKAEAAYRAEVVDNVMYKIKWERNLNLSARMVEVTEDFIDHRQEDVIAYMEEGRAYFEPWNVANEALKTSPDWALILADPLLCPEGEEEGSDCAAIADALNMTIEDKWLGDLDLVKDMSFSRRERDLLADNAAYLAAVDPKWQALASAAVPYAGEVAGLFKEVDAWMRGQVAELALVMTNLAYDSPQGVTEDVEAWLDDYQAVMFWCFQIPAYILLIVLTLYLVGALGGAWFPVGSRTKRRAANALGVGTMVFFCSSLLLWLFTVLMFATGSTMQKLGCETLEDPAESDLYAEFERDISEQLRKAFNSTALDGAEWDLPLMLYECQDEQALYSILDLEQGRRRRRKNRGLPVGRRRCCS